MMIYLLTFVLAAFCSLIAYKNRTKKIIFFIFSGLAVIIPSVIAGLRATNIGTDVKVYLIPLYKAALSCETFSAFHKMISAHDIELLFEILVYIPTRIFSNINVTMFFVHLPICLFLYMGANCFKDKGHPSIIYLFVLLAFYNMSLNIMRQFIAIAIVFYGYKFLLKKEFLKYIITVIIASFFHSSAIIALSFVLIVLICNSKNKILYSFFLIIFLCVGLVLYNKLLTLLSGIGIIPYKYVLRYSIINSQLHINLADNIIRLYPLLLMFFQSRTLKNTENNTFFAIISIYDLILFQMSLFVVGIQRICIYFTMFSFINIGRIIRQSKYNKTPIALTSLVVYLAYFIVSYVYIGIAETYPYVFGI